MHQTMEIYMSRKKRVPGFYNPDSNRVFDPQVTDESLGCTKLNKIYLERKKESPPPHPRDPDRRNCPQPHYSRFLTNNARTLNEPICIIQSENLSDEGNNWWSHHNPTEDQKVPSVTKDTTQRNDFICHESYTPVSLKGRNYFLTTSKGIVPVNPPKKPQDPGETLLEKISFDHDFNSRSAAVHRRGRLHGCFVWDRIVKDSAGNDVIETAWNREELQKPSSAIDLTSHTQNRRNEKENTSSPPVDHIPPIDGLPPP